jgi:hypothetical protein
MNERFAFVKQGIGHAWGSGLGACKGLDCRRVVAGAKCCDAATKVPFGLRQTLQLKYDAESAQA